MLFPMLDTNISHFLLYYNFILLLFEAKIFEAMEKKSKPSSSYELFW